MKRLLLLVTVLVVSGTRADTLRPQPVCGVDPSTGGCVLMKVATDGTVQVAGSLSVSGTADLPGNTATFNANNVCTAVLAAGEQSVGFHLTAGTLDGTLTPYITNQTGAINCATAGTCTATTFSSGGTIVVTNPNGVKDVGVNLVSTRQVQVCTTTYNSGSATGVVTATFVQAASSSGGGGGTSSTFGAAFPGSGTASGFKDSSGANMAAGNLDASGNLKVNVAAGGSSTGDVVGSTATLNANGICATVLMAGRNGAALQIVGGGNLVGTLSPSSSNDATPSGNGCNPATGTWKSANFITDEQLNYAPTTFSNGVAQRVPLLTGGAASCVRVCTTAYTSGSSNAFLTATVQPANFLFGKVIAVGDASNAALALDASVDGILISPGASTTLKQGPMVMGAATTAAPSYTTATVDPLSLQTDGSLRVAVTNTPAVTGTVTANIGTSGSLALDATLTGGTAKSIVRGGAKGSTTAADVTSTSNGTDHNALDVELWLSGSALDPRQIRALTSSDTVTVVQGTGTNLHIVCDSGCSSSAGFADLGIFTTGTTAINPVGGLFDDTPPTAVTTGKAAAARITNNRALHINLRNQAGTEIGTAGAPVRTDPTGTTTQPISGTVTANIGTSGSLALDASVTGLQVSQGSTTSGQKGELIQGAVTTSAPTYTTGQTDPLSLTTAGALRTDSSATTQPVSGTVTANQGGTWTVQPGNTANTTAWKVDGSAVTQPVSGTVTTTPPSNASTNVAQFGGTNVSTGTGTGGAGIPRVTVSNDSNVLATQSGTWTVQQGGAPWSENITQINGTTILTGAGVTGAGSARMTFATSDGNVVATANTGRLQVDVVTGGGSNASVGTSRSAAPTSSTQIGGIDAFNVLQPVKTEQDGTVDVRITNTNLKLQIAPKVQVSNLFIKPPNAPPTYTDPAVVVTQSPIPAPLCPLQAAISQTAGAITIAGKTGKVTYICKVFIVSTTAQSLSITEGTGATCGTNALALAGSTTVANGMALAANGGWVEGTGAAIAYTAQRPGDDVCLLQSGAGNVAGSFSYVQF